jgi:hypothetical protein
MPMRLMVCGILILSVSIFASPQPDRTGIADIAARHLQAIGGREVVRGIHSIVVRGIYHEPGTIPESAPLIPHAYQAFMRPYYEVIGDPAEPHPEIREGYDGSAWEYYRDPGIVLRTVGAAAAATRHASEFMQDSLLDYEDKGTRLDLQGTQQLGGHAVYRIRATLADGFQKLMFVDATTDLIVAERKSAPIHAFGGIVATEMRFEDFRPEGGLVMFHRSREIDMATGNVLNEFRRLRIEINGVNDPSIFSPAPYARTPLQQCLEQLYMERADPTAVIYTYREFRRRHPEVDTRDGVEFVGYQMVKMSDVKGAIALLGANAADYPHSASAQFGLGRADEAAGDRSSAKRAFQKALRVDPNFTRASDGLKAVR